MSAIKVLHLSDTHFGKHEDEKREAVIAFVQKMQPDIAVITGDVLDFPLSWSSKAFDQAKTFLDDLRRHVPWVTTIPGNHDALFGSLFLDRFWRKIQSRRSFVQYAEVRGQGVCLIGVDSTHFSLRSANNTGHFDAIRAGALQVELDRLERQPNVNMDDVITLALVHHHPVPTTTSEKESLLYFNNAGLFLSFAARNRVRLVLHGHQHDPNFAKISFGSGRDEDVIGILSAGACTRADQGKPEISGCGHLFLINIDKDRSIIDSCYYHRSERQFHALDQLKVPRVVSAEPRFLTVEQVFRVTPGGDMHAHETRRYRRVDARPCGVKLGIGSDDESSPGVTGLAPLGLSATLDGMPVLTTLEEDEPHSKILLIDAGSGNPGADFVVAIDYTWPNAFQRLLTKGVDSGELTIVSKGVEWCRVVIDVAPAGRSFLDLTVRAIERDSIVTADAGPSTRTITVKAPRGRISWLMTIGTPFPS